MRKISKLFLTLAAAFSLISVVSATNLEAYDDDEIAPKLALFVDDSTNTTTVKMKQWQGYDEPGYFGYNRLTLENITTQVRIEETDLNIQEAGTYSIRYQVTANGYTTKAKRTVIVEEASKPAGWTNPHPNGLPGYIPTNTGTLNDSTSGSSNSNNDALIAQKDAQIAALEKELEELREQKEVIVEKEVIKEVPVEKEVIVEKEVQVTNWAITIGAFVAGLICGIAGTYLYFSSKKDEDKKGTSPKK